MKNYQITITVNATGDDEDHAYEQALEQITDGQFTPQIKDLSNDNEDQPLAADMLQQIGEWLDYMRGELEKEQIDLVEISEIERVYEITKEQE